MFSSAFRLKLFLMGSSSRLQIIWTTIMSQGSPYLSSLGLSSSIISLVWLAGPLSGTFVQPYIGVLSDSCLHSWGRRRPFIVFGAISTIVCTMALPWTGDTVAFFFRRFSEDETDSRHSEQLLTQILASGWIWALNISIQPVQSGIRALIVDSVPLSQQVRASAYASCVIGIGSILGYSTAFLDLPLLFPWLGNTQIKGICGIASLALGSTVTITCLTTKERKLDAGQVPKQKTGILARVRELTLSFRMIPRRILKVFAAQFFAWLSWFPFMFYITTYMAQLYGTSSLMQTSSIALPGKSPASMTRDSTRYATLSLVFFATTALLTNLLAPRCISTNSSTSSRHQARSHNAAAAEPLLEEAEPSVHGSEGLSSFTRTSNGGKQEPHSVYSRYMASWLTLPRLWAASHIFRPAVLLATALTDSLLVSTVLVGMLGMSWAMTQWVPYALISAEIAKTQTHLPASLQLTAQSASSSGYRLLDAVHGDAHETDDVPGDAEKAADAGRGKQKMVLQAGAVMGMQNMAIATPQMVGALLCSLLFWALAKCEITGGAAAGWVMRILQLSSLVAAWLASQIEWD
ncbi:hypothetical protein JHW43_001112 [Diplocarpon mali]|nr:hypothetical protein JHW43_001112 [Diplocarpon mali]